MIVRVGETGGGPRFDASDRFIVSDLPGITGRLVQVGGTNNERQYHTEYETFGRITHSSMIGYGWDEGPVSWTVTDRFGTRHVFGGFTTTKYGARWPDKRAIWYLDYVEDTFGNRITYSYSGYGRPLKIVWGSYELDFGYDPVSLQHETIGGLVLGRAHRLSAITVYAVNGSARTPIRAYDLVYTDLPRTGRSFLERIIERDPASGQTLPPTVFSIGGPPAAQATGVVFGGTEDQWMGRALGGVTWSAQTDGLRDMDGDGLLDHVHTLGTGSLGGADERITVRINAGSGFEAPERWPESWLHLTSVQPNPNGSRTVMEDLIDFDGDGDADRVSCGSTTGGWSVRFNNGNKAFSSVQVWSGAGCANKSLYSNDIVGLGLRDASADGASERAGVMDLNGDGWLDFVDCASSNECTAYINDGSSGFRVVSMLGGPLLILAGRVAGTFSGGSHAIEVVSRFIDMNGDGFLDWVEATSPLWKVRFGRGDGTFGENTEWSGTETLTRVEYRHEHSSGLCIPIGLIEVDGDGLPDLIGGGGVRYNTGSGFAPLDNQAPFVAYITCRGSGYEYNFLDFDGDGIGELIYNNTNDNWAGGGADRYPYRHLVREISQPYGGVTTLTYLASTSSTAAPGKDFVVGGAPLVRALTTRSGTHWNPSESHWRIFTYHGGKKYRSRDLLMSLGFTYVSDLDASTSHMTVRYFTQSAPSNVGQLYFQHVYHSTGTGSKLLQREYVDFVTDLAAPYYTPVRNRYVYTGDARTNADRVTRASYTYDEYGNTVVETSWGDVNISGDERRVIRRFHPNPLAWIVSLPGEVLFYEGRDALPQMRRRVELFFYDGATNTTDPPTKGFLSRHTIGGSDHGGNWDYSVTHYNHDATLTYVQDPLGRITSVTDPRGNRSTRTYDPAYRTFVVREQNALRHITRTAYYGVNGDPVNGGSWGKLQWVQEPNGEGKPDRERYRTSYTYDAFGRVTQVIRPLDDVVTAGTPFSERFSYGIRDGSNHYVCRFQRQSSSSTSVVLTCQCQDGFGRTNQVLEGKFPRRFSTKILYNSQGLVSAQSLPSALPVADSRLTRFEYDALGRVTEIDQPNGAVGSSRVSTIAYEGWDKIVTNERGFNTTHRHDAYRRVNRVTDALGSTTSYTYDIFGNTTSVTDAQGNAITWTYDGHGRKRSMTDSDLGSYTYTYDEAGNVVREIGGAGTRLMRYSYDALNRVLTKDEGDDGTIETTFEYDRPSVNGIGRMTKVIRVGEITLTTSYTYDRRGRVAGETRSAVGARSFAFTSRTAYNSMDQVAERFFPNGTKATYAYNGHGKVETIAGLVRNVEYSPTGRMTRITYVSGQVITLNYEPDADRLTRIRATVRDAVLFDQSYSWDDIDNLAYREDAVEQYHRDYSYDALDRLVQATYTKPVCNRFLRFLCYNTTATAEEYAYDAIGNLTSKNGRPQAYGNGVPFGGPHAISHADIDRDGVLEVSEAFHYNPRGNLVSGNGRAYTWSMNDMPLTIQDMKRNSLTEFSYDGLGRRVFSRVDVGSVTVEISYGASEFQRRTEGGVTTDVATVFLNGIRVATLDAGGNAQFYVCDYLGSAAVVTDAGGNVLERVVYDAFGVRTNDTNEGVSPYKFTGQEWDRGTDLYNYNARLFDPEIGRFISADGLLAGIYNPQALNRYSYALNNPLRYVDPSGHRPRRSGFWGAALAPLRALGGELHDLVYGTLEGDWAEAGRAGANLAIFAASVAATTATGGLTAYPSAYIVLNVEISMATATAFAVANDVNDSDILRTAVIGGLIGGATAAIRVAFWRSELMVTTRTGHGSTAALGAGASTMEEVAEASLANRLTREDMGLMLTANEAFPVSGNLMAGLHEAYYPYGAGIPIIGPIIRDLTNAVITVPMLGWVGMIDQPALMMLTCQTYGSSPTCR